MTQKTFKGCCYLVISDLIVLSNFFSWTDVILINIVSPHQHQSQTKIRNVVENCILPFLYGTLLKFVKNLKYLCFSKDESTPYTLHLTLVYDTELSGVHKGIFFRNVKNKVFKQKLVIDYSIMYTIH